MYRFGYDLLWTVLLMIITVSIAHLDYEIDMTNRNNLSRPISPDLALGLTQEQSTYLIYKRQPATLQDARFFCSMYGHLPGDCNLFRIDEKWHNDTMTSTMEAFPELQNQYLWLNYDVNEGEITDALNDSVPLEYANVNDYNGSDAIVYQYKTEHWQAGNDVGVWVNVDSSGKYPYFCECKNGCQPGISGCQLFEACTHLDTLRVLCTCPVGKTGDLCMQCAAGYRGPAPYCEIDDCLNIVIPCLNGGHCLDGDDTYSCECTDTGYEGRFCEVEIDECASNPCQRGTCVDHILSFDCVCPQGYVGDYCQSKDALSELDVSNFLYFCFGTEDFSFEIRQDTHYIMLVSLYSPVVPIQCC